MAVEISTTVPNLSQRVAKNTLIMFLGQALSLLANLGVTVLLARHLSKSGFGIFSYALVFVGFFAVLAEFGMKPILVREISRQPERTGIILGNTILIKLALILLAITFAVAGSFLFHFSSELRMVIWILTGNIFISSKLYTFRIIFESIFHVQLRMVMPVIWQTIDALVLVFATSLLIWVKAPLAAIVAAYVLCNLPGFILTLWGTWKIVRPRFILDKELCRMLLRESTPLFFSAGLMVFYDRFDVILLEAMKGHDSVGLYAAAFRLVSPLSVIPLAVVSSLYPLMSKYGIASAEKLKKTFTSGMKILFVIGLPFALGATFFHEKIFYVLYTPVFQPAAEAFGVLMWAQAFVFLNYFLADFNTAIGRQRVNFWAALLMCTTNLGLNAILIPRWDTLGASSAKLATNILGFGFLFWYSSRHVSSALVLTAPRLLSVAAVFGAWLLVVRDMNFVVVLISSAAIYAVLLLLFGVFDADERQLFDPFLRRFKSNHS